jgi:UDP-glucose 4-epimerase
MKIFITGIAGFLGSYLAEALIQLGHQVSGCDNLMGGYVDNVPEEAEFMQMDCRYLNAMKKCLVNVDVLVRAACAAYEGLSVFSPHLITQNTSQISATVFSAAVHDNVKRVVFCSSMARYGEQSRVPFTEEMVPKPRDPYGIAKLAAENLLISLSETFNFQYVIVVPHNIIGPRQKYDDPFRNVASIMINRMLQGKQPLIYGDGEQKRCFSFIQDTLGPLVNLVLSDEIHNEIINIGPDEEFVTINHLAKVIAQQLDFKLDPIYLPARPREVKLAACSADKARNLLNYRTKFTLDMGIAQMIGYIRTRGTRKFRYHLDVEITNAMTPKSWTERLF